MHKLVSALSAIALAGGVALAATPAAVAAAIPGCKLTMVTPTKVSGKQIRFGATAECTTTTGLTIP